jgi:alpha-glucan,water dikinase
MMNTETITTESGIAIRIEKKVLDDSSELIFRIDKHADCLLHWGLLRGPHMQWQIPPEQAWPEGSRAFDHAALQSPFIRRNGSGEIIIRLGPSTEFRLIDFVLFLPEQGRWDNNRGRNYRVEISVTGEEPPSTRSLGDFDLDRLSDEIIEKEMSPNSWTLMHRFNLCYDLLDKIRSNDLDGMALIFVWLRFSAIRQLDWQRNYNTKPRELGHAMDRLTLKFAERYVKEKGEREMIRLIMTTLGRGSNAQRVRDEVLNIMHRHHIKEVSGHFMEEWHQKLHNNTTPDDIVICEAYLDFLRSNGDLRRFYQRLEEGGVTKERLESYERPITSDPDFIPHLKDALTNDFEHFLRILREVHSGTDLRAAIQASRYLFDAEMHGLMDFIQSHQNDGDLNLISKKITESRMRIAAYGIEEPSYKVRDLLFLDIALEDFLRVLAERNLGPQTGRDQLEEMMTEILGNLCISNIDSDLQKCLEHWKRLRKIPHSGREWPLHAEAVLERIGRAIASFSDSYHRLLQPKAEFLGNAFHADSWTITLFSEEVLRGRPAFVLSMVLRYLDPILRKSAELGNWQVISRGRGAGEVKVMDALKEVQGNSFAHPVVLIADKIAGDEEIPQGAVAIITPALIDSLSHLAIRARNAGVLFAICYDPETIGRLKSLEGRVLRVNIMNSRDISFVESHEDMGSTEARPIAVNTDIKKVGFTVYAVPMSDFNEGNVGYKSNKLRNIQEKLPGWIGLPASAALPFGVFEKVLAEENNKDIAEKYAELPRRLEEAEGKERAEALAELREAVLAVKAPEELVTSLRRVMEGARLVWPSAWDETWMCIKRVWSSKWNERAYLSRKANGIPHDALVMSVLIQRVIESDYSFVIHTVNPITEAKDEVYAEVVPGLGETLAANYPGRALGFTCKKGGKEPYLLSFPSKSTGLYGGGLIFRSDSNGEDLAGYAGAGLYDSFMLPKPRGVSLDYAGDSLVWDESFRKGLLTAISDIGTVVEDVMKYPQDIEGAYSKGQYFVVQTRPQAGIENAGTENA